MAYWKGECPVDDQSLDGANVIWTDIFFYLLPGGCGKFGNNLNSQGFPNPAPLAKLNTWLPNNAIHLENVPMDYQIPQSGTSRASLTRQIETFLPYPVKVDTGDCVVVIYGATDNETQIHAVLAP